MPSGSPEHEKGQPGISQAALFGLCPKCGSKTMFAGMLAFAGQCRACGLDYSRFNVGDGPAALVTLAVGTITVSLAIWLQLSLAPPLWVHAVLWVPLTLVLVIGLLRLTKAGLLASEYQNEAGEAGRREP